MVRSRFWGATWLDGLGHLGASVRKRFGFLGDLLGLLVLTLRQVVRLRELGPRQVFWTLFKRQLFNTGFKATYVNCALAVMLGVGIAAQPFSLVQQLDHFAEIYRVVVVLELAPLISGIILIARSATAVTSEIGHLQLMDEFEVLRGQGVSPAFIFMLPIFFAFPLSLLLMFVYFNIAALLSTVMYIELFTVTNYDHATLLAQVVENITLRDIWTLVAKAIFGGILIGLVSLHAGWQVGDRFTDIARAISSSTTSLLLLFFVFNLLLSLFAY